MVLCWFALPVFAFLGIFSVKYRKLTKEALDCVFHTITFRKCKSGLDDRMKASAAGKALKIHPKLGKFVFKYFTILSILLMVFFAWSTYASVVGFYNFYYYGNCNGPESTGFCVFDPAGAYSTYSELDLGDSDEMVLPVLEDDDPIIGPLNAEFTVIEFGCYACPYTKKAEPTVKEVIEHYNGRVNFQFKTIVIPNHYESYAAALSSECFAEQGKYKEFHTEVFANQENLTTKFIDELSISLGMNNSQFRECVFDERYKSRVDEDTIMGIKARVGGTPTFFVGEKRIVGPKPLKTFITLIDRALEDMAE